MVFAEELRTKVAKSDFADPRLDRFRPLMDNVDFRETDLQSAF